MLKAVVWIGVCFALNVGLLYFSHLLFGFYQKTPMGPDFIASNPELANAIAKMSDMGFEQLSIPLTLTAFFTCLGIFAVCKLFFVARYITPMGIVGRAITCVLPISGVVSMLLPESLLIGGREMAFGLSIFPTLMIFNACFTITDELLPEADELIAFFHKKENPGNRFNDRR